MSMENVNVEVMDGESDGIVSMDDYEVVGNDFCGLYDAEAGEQNMLGVTGKVLQKEDESVL